MLQEKQYERVGEERTRTVDVRIIAATNRELKKEVTAGRFREDLYYRLNVFPLEVPPLRERKADIPLLTAHFLQQTAHRLRTPAPRFTETQARLLQSYDWPGNVRELQNVAERALILAQNGVLQFNLPNGASLNQPASGIADLTNAPDQSLEKGSVLSEAEMRGFERRNTLAALREAKWKINGPGGAAELLGIKPTTLVSRIQKMGLKRPW